MNILALETSADVLHLAVSTDSTFLSETRTVGRRFSEELVPRMKAICEDAHINLRELDLIVCTNGPGSFTGLRVGMSAAKGVSLAAGVPLVSLSTMEIMYQPLALVHEPVLAVMDAKKHRYYAALFQKGVRLTADRDLPIDELCREIAGFSDIIVTGPDSQVVVERLRDQVTQQGFKTKIHLDHLQYRSYGESMIQLGKKLLLEQGPDDIGSGPTYIRKSDAEVSLEERNKKSIPKEVQL